MGRPKKYFGSKAKINGQLHAKNAIYVVDIPPQLWNNWADMISDLGIENPSDLLEVHLDNYLRAQRRRNKDNVSEKISMEIAVDKNLLSVLNAVTEAHNKSHREFIVFFMRRIITRYRKHTDRYFKMLERYDKEVDIRKKNKIKKQLDGYAMLNNNKRK